MTKTRYIQKDLSTNLSKYVTDIDYWRIQLPRLLDGHGRLLFPCGGFGFLIESEDTIIYDGLGRRLGTQEELKDFIKRNNCIPEEDLFDNYITICQITFEEFEEIKKINLEIEKMTITHK